MGHHGNATAGGGKEHELCVYMCMCMCHYWSGQSTTSMAHRYYYLTQLLYVIHAKYEFMFVCVYICMCVFVGVCVCGRVSIESN